MDGFWTSPGEGASDRGSLDAAARRAKAAAVLQGVEEARRDAGHDRPRGTGQTVPTGIGGIDAVLPGGGLRRGAVHEWIGVERAADRAEVDLIGGEPGAQGVGAQRRDPPRRDLGREPARRRRSGGLPGGGPGGGPGAGTRAGTGGRARPSTPRSWSPPLSLLLGLASSASRGQRVVWVGEAVWPYAVALRRALGASGGAEVDACLFVRARTSADRLWAVDLALRCCGVSAVIADGSGLDLGSTRRLQLAAEASGGLCFLARPPWERGELSACATRWSVAWSHSPIPTRRWTVELLRCKGVQPGIHAQRVWTVEQSDATGGLHLAPDVRDRSGAAADAARSRVAIA